ncbi:MAG: CAP domain-containing protein [Candidatus Gracilibacteria bacterium]|nr:CAP domain-containing protein [Candidatus Gracilibacteria bacterium]
MKKIIILFVLFFSFSTVAFATDACDKFLPQEIHFMGKVTIVANFRDYPCVSKSNVLGASRIGDTYEIVSKVDGWYQIKLSDSQAYWIWDQAIEKVSDIEDSSNYTLTSKDRILINKFIFKVNEIVQERGLVYRQYLVRKIWQILNNGNYSDKNIAILQEVKDRISQIEIRKEEVVIQESTNLNNSSESNTYNLTNIDLSKVKETWLGRYNSVRSDLGRGNYSYNSTLEKTAIEWSELSKQRGEITHKRNSGDVYYDYAKITSWFKDRGVICKNVNSITHTENIGWGMYSCNDLDCTDELIGTIRSTFDFYMSEKNKSYKPHYESIVNPYFTIIGLGISIEDLGNSMYKYYLTVHFCTELE